jgi:hypothetical protein
MRIDTWWLPVLALLGATRGRSYVAIEPTWVHVRFGIFRFDVERRRVVSARTIRGNWLAGIGVHTNLVSGLIVNGSLDGLVELDLEPPQTFWLLFLRLRCRQLYVSLEQPDAFLAALGVPAVLPTR